MNKHLKPKLIFVMVLFGCFLATVIWVLSEKEQLDSADDLNLTRQISPQMPLKETAAPQHEPPSVQQPYQQKPAVYPGKSRLSDFSHLQLIGTAIDPNRTFAIILNKKKGTQSLFRPGDLIDGATLQNIFENKVILKYKDQLYTLMLEPDYQEESEQLSETSSGQTPPDHVLSYMDQERIENAWEETEELMNQIELSQHLENNAEKGVAVINVAENSVFEKIGLLKGDVILRVDDAEIMIEDDAMEIYNCLRTKETVQFVIKRNGETITLDYQTGN